MTVTVGFAEISGQTFLKTKKEKSGLMRRNNLFKNIDMALENYLKRQESENLALTA